MLFFEKKHSKDSIIIRRRKYILILATIPLILYFIIFPIFNISQDNFYVKIFWLIIIVFGVWMAIEGIICGTSLKKYKKSGNKIEYNRSGYFNNLKEAKILLK
jgi:hypothetical protein